MIASLIRERAQELGFARVGIGPAGPTSQAVHLHDWLDRGYHGLMGYMKKHLPIREDTRRIEPWARSVVSVSAPYRAPDEGAWADQWARYAVGDDYHRVLWDKLESLAAFIRAETGADIAARPATDSAPVLERNVATDLGVGWLGKSAMVIDPEWGTYTLLAELFVDIELESSGSPQPDRCGTCTACIDLCPTGAIVAPFQVDARRCISYLTIEVRGPIPRPMRPLIGGHLFGCDVCQEVCPWNRKARLTPMQEFAARPELVALQAADVLMLTPDAFGAVFRGTSMHRTRRKGLARNAAVVLGNTGDRAWVPKLDEALSAHDDPLVRGHAAWALGALGGEAARAALERGLGREEASYVIEEIRYALDAS